MVKVFSPFALIKKPAPEWQQVGNYHECYQKSERTDYQTHIRENFKRKIYSAEKHLKNAGGFYYGKD